MYLRFVVDQIDQDSERRLGIFHAMYALLDSDSIAQSTQAGLEEMRVWFKNNLEIPTRFTAAKPPYYRKQARAISWFKPSAKEHIDRMYQMMRILESHNISVSVLKAERVGYVVYEDEFQIVAEPFADLFC